LVTFAIALSVWTCAQAAAENVVGKTEYLQACASCHGNDGKGDGPAATELKTPPPDLTLLAKSNDGVFPSKVLHDIIDGRRTLRAHGTYEMPVWGNIFSQNSSNNSQKRIDDISEYLKAIQAQ
jgi:mono/diheme cytochrome c family protein